MVDGSDGPFQPRGNTRGTADGEATQDLRRSTALPCRIFDLSPRNFIGYGYYSSSSPTAITKGLHGWWEFFSRKRSVTNAYERAALSTMKSSGYSERLS